MDHIQMVSNNIKSTNKDNNNNNGCGNSRRRIFEFASGTGRKRLPSFFPNLEATHVMSTTAAAPSSAPTAITTPSPHSSSSTSSRLQQKIELVCKDLPKSSRNLFNQLSCENAEILCDYILAEKRSINISPKTASYKIAILTYLARDAGNKSFLLMDELDIQSRLSKLQKGDEEDPLHHWIGYYNHHVVEFRKFFKWLHEPQLPQEKRDLPPFMANIRRLRRKEKAIYAPDELWTADNVEVFVKYCPKTAAGVRDSAIIAMQVEDMAGVRPVELWNLKVCDIKFKQTLDGRKYVQLPINSPKTGQRIVPLLSSVPYLKLWLSVHPDGTNPNAWLFCSMASRSLGGKMTTHNMLDNFTRSYKPYFQKLLDESEKGLRDVLEEDRHKIKDLLSKPWNPYLHRHTGLSRAARVLKDSTAFRKHSGHSLTSDMPDVYIHWDNYESSESMLEARGVITEEKARLDQQQARKQPRTCPDCGEINTPDAIICFACKHVLTREGYEQAIDSEKKIMSEKVDKMIEEKLSDKQFREHVSRVWFEKWRFQPPTK
jgi:integrase